MANENQIKILKQGVEVWNKWRIENPDEKTELSRANLNLVRSASLTACSIKGDSRIDII